MSEEVPSEMDHCSVFKMFTRSCQELDTVGKIMHHGWQDHARSWQSYQDPKYSVGAEIGWNEIS